MRAPGGRGCHPCSTAGLSPKELQGPVDGLATCHGVVGEAPCPMGTGRRVLTSRQRRRFLKVGVWNVWGLRGKEPELVREAEKYRLDIIALSETKLRGNEAQELDGGWCLFHSGVGPEVRARAGVGILTSPRMTELVVEWLPRSERIGVLRLRVGGVGLALVATYAPTVGNEYENFLEDLGRALDEVPATDSLMLLGDLNAHVGVDDSRWRGVIGRNGDADLNGNGRLLLDFCSTSGLTIMNTFFRHRDVHKYTWQRVSSEQRSLIDLVIVSEDLRSRVTDVRVWRGAELSTDHHLVVCKLRLSHLSGVRKDRKVWRIRWEELRRTEVAEAFAASVHQRFEEIPTVESDVETEWQLFKTGVIGAAAITCGEKRVSGSLARPCTPWFTEEVRVVVRAKKEAYRVWLANPSPESRRAYVDA